MGQISSYNDAFDKWQSTWIAEKGRPIDIGIVLPAEFHRVETLSPPPGQGRFPYWCPNRSLEPQGDGGPPANPYILSFASRAASFVAAVASHHVKTVWIWNESNLLTNNVQPNQNCSSDIEWSQAQNSLGPEVFGSLSHRTAEAIKAALAQIGITDVMIYCGSLSVLRRFDPAGGGVADYLKRMYAFLNGGQPDPENPTTPFPYAWDGLSLNMLGEDVDEEYAAAVYNSIDAIKIRAKDSKPVIIGEWGAGFPEGGSQISRATALTMFNGIRKSFLTMYFYSHYFHKQRELPPEPERYTIWGARQWTSSAGDYEPVPGQGGKFAWYDYLVEFYAFPDVD